MDADQFDYWKIQPIIGIALGRGSGFSLKCRGRALPDPGAACSPTMR